MPGVATPLGNHFQQEEDPMKHSEIEVKCRMNPESIAALLEDLAQSFRKGKLVVRKDSSFVTLTPCSEIDMEVGASAKKGKFKFEIQLKWREDEPSAGPAEPAFVISCEEPCFEKDETEPEDTVRNELLFRKF